MNNLKQEADQYRRRVRELEEQIQSDDRVERLENSLKNTQDRADELEFQLSKVKQARSKSMLAIMANSMFLGSYYPKGRA